MFFFKKNLLGGIAVSFYTRGYLHIISVNIRGVLEILLEKLYIILEILLQENELKVKMTIHCKGRNTKAIKSVNHDIFKK